MKDQKFIDLIEKYRNEFYRYVYRNLWNSSQVDDVFSSAVLAAYEGLHKFQEGTNFRAWMYKILTNKCFSANREARRSGVDIESIDDYLPAQDADLYQEVLEDPEWFVEEVSDEVVRAMSQLRSVERTCFLLLALGKYSYKEIASIVDIPVGTVMTHLARGRAKMRRTLTSFAQEEGILPRSENHGQSQETRAQA